MHAAPCLPSSHRPSSATAPRYPPTTTPHRRPVVRRGRLHRASPPTTTPRSASPRPPVRRRWLHLASLTTTTPRPAGLHLAAGTARRISSACTRYLCRPTVSHDHVGELLHSRASPARTSLRPARPAASPYLARAAHCRRLLMSNLCLGSSTYAHVYLHRSRVPNCIMLFLFLAVLYCRISHHE